MAIKQTNVRAQQSITNKQYMVYYMYMTGKIIEHHNGIHSKIQL